MNEKLAAFSLNGPPCGRVSGRIYKSGGWPRQLVAWVAQQQEEQLHNRLDLIEDLLAFGHRQFLPVPPIDDR
jgi:hypothetical protein